MLALAPLLAITLAGAVLRFWALNKVPGNMFYDSAPRSMSLSWHNFFFGAFEPGAQVSVDKAPADLWMQVAAVKVFGFNTTAVKLPEVLGAILAIPLLYDLVRRIFGHRAGLGAAAALAVLPVSIVTAHSDTMDSVMMFFDVLAAWLVVVGAQRRKVWPVIAAGAVLGVAFNVKLFEALIVLPAIGLLVLLAVDFPWRRKALALGGSLVAFVAVSLSWIVAASMTPLSGRPWPIGSTNGSIWDVVFIFNGLDRLQGPASPAAYALDPPGPLRLLQTAGHNYAAGIGTVLLAGVVLGVAAGAVALVRWRAGTRFSRLQVPGAVFLGVWFILGVALMSDMQRLQPRYLEAITPAVAAAVGIGCAGLVAATAARGRLGAVPLIGAVAATAIGGVLLVHPPVWAIAAALAAAVAVGVVAMAAPGRRSATALTALALIAVLAVPASGAITAARQHRSDAGLANTTPPAQVAGLSRFLTSHQGQARYETASPNVMRASPLIIHDARPVLMLTSLYGRPLIDAAQLQRLVATRQVRYLLGRPTCPSRNCPSAIRWAVGHSQRVTGVAGLPPGGVYRLTATPAAGRTR
jgi:4-amino-4-deoxy-L-arabinose transferase-like glycosyltransferase